MTTLLIMLILGKISSGTNFRGLMAPPPRKNSRTLAHRSTFSFGFQDQPEAPARDELNDSWQLKNGRVQTRPVFDRINMINKILMRLSRSSSSSCPAAKKWFGEDHAVAVAGICCEGIGSGLGRAGVGVDAVQVQIHHAQASRPQHMREVSGFVDNLFGVCHLVHFRNLPDSNFKLMVFLGLNEAQFPDFSGKLFGSRTVSDGC